MLIHNTHNHFSHMSFVVHRDADAQDAPAGKKNKVEGSDEVEKKKKYVAALNGRQKKAAVMLVGVTKKAHELNNAEMEEALDKHDDPKDPLSLTRDFLRVLSSSREFYLDVDGGEGKRLAQDPLVYENGTRVEGATQTERMVSNLRTYLTKPENGKKKGVCCVMLVCI